MEQNELYRRVEDLPDQVKRALGHLPRALRIWMNAFNNAWRTYSRRVEDRRRLEQICVRVAWTAVRIAGYRRIGGKWRRVKKG